MITIRPSAERGHFNHGWLDTKHTFSFSSYYDPNYMGFRDLRVINQDIVQPNQGFDLHRHHDMEIITYVLRGEVTHRDSMGNKGVIHAGEIQCMTAGTGVQHSEFNLGEEELELLQIWIIPEREGLKPHYQQMAYKKEPPQMKLLVSPTGQQDSLIIHQDARVFTVSLLKEEKWEYKILANRYVWLQLIKGQLKINNKIELLPGDGAAFSHENKINLTAVEEVEFLLFDLK